VSEIKTLVLQKPEIEKPGKPTRPDIPQEDPQRQPAEVPPSALPSPDIMLDR